MKHILVSVDGSELSAKALDLGLDIATAFNSAVTIINVVPLEAITAPWVGKESMVYEITEESKNDSNKILSGAKQKFEGTKLTVEVVSAFGNIADEILEFASEHDVDFIIMGSYSIGNLKRRLFTGSITTIILHHTNVPVLVVK
jgi:nucleotide-binding universal stress UspA family protein